MQEAQQVVVLNSYMIYSTSHLMVVECGGLLNLTYESDSDKILVMRMGAIKAKRTLVIQGQFVDNYNAGNQNYTTASGFRQSSPYRYTDVNGRVKSVNRLQIGYNEFYDETPTLVEDTDLAYNYGNSLDDGI